MKLEIKEMWKFNPKNGKFEAHQVVKVEDLRALLEEKIRNSLSETDTRPYRELLASLLEKEVEI